jgi:hypothetical protein
MARTGNPVAVTVVQSVDQMQISRTAASGTNRQRSGEVGFCSSGEGRRFLMAQMDPIQFSGRADRVGNAVERVAGNSIDSLDSCFRENIHQQVRYFFLRHEALFSREILRKLT